MVVSIQEVLRPLLIVCFIMGLGAYPMKELNLKIQWIAYLNIVYRLTIWFSYAYLLYYTLTSFVWTVDQNIVYNVILTINIFTVVASIIMSFYYQKRFEINLKKLSIVDDSLEELGVPKAYEKIYTCSKSVIIGWIAYSLASNFCEMIWWEYLEESMSWELRLFIAYILNHCNHINAFTDILFTFLLWFIGTRFDKINEHIQRLLVREDYGLRCTWKKSVVAFHRYTLCTDYKQTIWISMHLHLELCRIARELNFIFGAQITFGMAAYLIYITSLCYGLCMMLTQKYQNEILSLLWFNVSFWSFGFLMRLYIVNYMCESVTVKANEINKIIHQLTNTFQYTDVCKEVYQFTLQVMHHPLKLTGMNLFYLGNECLRKFCMTTVTFVIIMVQMNIYINL